MIEIEFPLLLLIWFNKQKTPTPTHTHCAIKTISFFIKTKKTLANPNKNQSKPLFLAKYIPPTPPDNRISSNDLRRQITNSPCPSPTPIFQKLYIAVSHWERILADSPNILHEKHRIIKDLESLGTQNNCFFPSSRDDGDDTDDECSNEPSPIRYSAENVNALRFLDGKIFQKSISNDTQEGDSNR